MAIQRAAPMPVPSDDLALIRARLSPQYGAEVWDGDDRRILIIRVPHDEPDPVNDVESAIEYLEPNVVDGITHAVMVGNASAAQVYASPLQQLMQDRVAFDKRLATSWREQLPGHLAHVAFQSPEDPRRRWRLAVRLPCASVKDVTEEMLEDLADGIGPELDTPRYKRLAAVYLIAAEDDVRMSPDTFVSELLAKWQDEDRKRRIEEERAAKEAAERKRRQREHEAVLREVEKRVNQNVARAPLRTTRASPNEAARRAPLAEAETTLGTKPEVRHVHDRIDTLGDLPAAIAEEVEAHEATRGVLEERVDEMRARIDRVISHEPRPPGHLSDAPIAPRAHRKARRDRDAAAPDVDDRPTPADDGTPEQRLQRRLRAAGFDMLRNPEAPGHHIDIAAERPEGDPQRIVVCFAECLDTETAKQLLKTARELDVDMVLCVTERIQPEGQRILVATKVQVIRPDQMGKLAF